MTEPPNLHLILIIVSLMAGGVAGWAVRDWKAELDRLRERFDSGKSERD